MPLSKIAVMFSTANGGFREGSGNASTQLENLSIIFKK